MSESKNTKRLVEQYLKNMHVRHGVEMDRRIVQDSTEAMEQTLRARATSARSGIGRTIMTYRARRIAAVIALAVVLAGAVGLSGGSVAFSQVGHAVSSTLTRLKELIMEIRTGEPTAQTPQPPAAPADTDEQAPNPNVRAVMCAARFFNIPASEQDLRQSLGNQGIELIQASVRPEIYYATLGQEQAERVEGALTVGSRMSPRFIVREGQQAMIACDIFGLAWLPTLSSDGKRIESSFSFHDGQTGFEIPNVSTEEGGAILVLAKAIVPMGEDTLVLLRVSRTQ